MDIGSDSSDDDLLGDAEAEMVHDADGPDAAEGAFDDDAAEDEEESLQQLGISENSRFMDRPEDLAADENMSEVDRVRERVLRRIAANTGDFQSLNLRRQLDQSPSSSSSSSNRRSGLSQQRRATFQPLPATPAACMQRPSAGGVFVVDAPPPHPIRDVVTLPKLYSVGPDSKSPRNS